jgi:hypothetical protein
MAEKLPHGKVCAYTAVDAAATMTKLMGVA